MEKTWAKTIARAIATESNGGTDPVSRFRRPDACKHDSGLTSVNRWYTVTVLHSQAFLERP